MKVIFLDFDGVLRLELARPGVGGATAYQFGDFDPAAVERLNAIAFKGRAGVVVSSSWKRSHDVPALEAVLRRAGYAGPCYGATPDLPGEAERPGSMRGFEIAVWLAARVAAGSPVEAFVMIDDGRHTSCLPWLDARLVQPQSAAGLQDEHVLQAVALLGEST